MPKYRVEFINARRARRWFQEYELENSLPFKQQAEKPVTDSGEKNADDKYNQNENHCTCNFTINVIFHWWNKNVYLVCKWKLTIEEKIKLSLHQKLRGDNFMHMWQHICKAYAYCSCMLKFIIRLSHMVSGVFCSIAVDMNGKLFKIWPFNWRKISFFCSFILTQKNGKTIVNLKQIKQSTWTENQ